MNATSLYVSTCRLVLQANPEDPGCWADLYRLIPYLRQSLSCTVCGNLLIEPYTPTETNCQHHVCRSCKGGKKKLKPSCSWCKNYEKYVENVQLRILLQCYKKLCEYIINSSIYRLMCKTTASGDTNIVNMTDLIQEGAGFKDEFKSNSGLSKSAYSILPCIYASASTQTITQAINLNNDSDIAIDEDVSVAKSNLSNGSSIYSVTYAGSGNKMVIKRKAMLNKGEMENCENLRLIKGSSFKRPIHRRGNFRGRGRGFKDDEKANNTGVGNCTVSSNNVNTGRVTVKKKKLGCRCGNATASPGKLTCCGQRCPCYVDSKACLDCKCRGCRNPHTKEGQKVIRDPIDSTNTKLQSPAQLQPDEGIPMKGSANIITESPSNVNREKRSCNFSVDETFQHQNGITITVESIENVLQLSPLLYEGYIPCNRKSHYMGYTPSNQFTQVQTCLQMLIRTQACTKTCNELWSLASYKPLSLARMKTTSFEIQDENKIKEVMVKITFTGNTLSESIQIPIVNKRADIELTANLNVEDMNPHLMDEILSNPVLFTVVDCSSPVTFPVTTTTPSQVDKEVRKKKSKSSTTPLTASKSTMPSNRVIGICNLDIGSLVMGEKRIKETLVVDSEKKVLAPETVAWTKLPKLVVVASTGSEPLIPETKARLNNVLSITVESVYNVPEYISEGSTFDACITVPTVGDKTSRVKFPNGTVTWTKDFACRKKWVTLSHLDGLGARSKYRITPDSCDILSDLGECINLGNEIMKPQKMIQWNMWKNSLMLKADANYFCSKIMKYRVWPMEVLLPNKSKEQIQKVKSAKSDKKSKPAPSGNAPNPDHFTAFLNLSPLLSPGVTKARVAGRLLTYSRSDLISKFGAESVLLHSQTSVGTIKSKTTDRPSAKDLEDIKDGAGMPLFNDDGSPTFIIVEVELLKPLCQKRDRETLEEDLKAYLSVKGKLNKKITNLNYVEQNFERTILEAVSTLTKEYQAFRTMEKYNKEEQNVDSTLFYEFLCKRKSFFKVRATLEEKVFELATEKYGSLRNYKIKLPQLYIYLVNEMHKITNRHPIGQEDVSILHCDGELQFYAEEALEEGDYELAKEYLFSKLSRNTANPDYWLDIAVYYMRLGAVEEAIEAAKEALYLDFYHQIGLLMYALLMARMNNASVAIMTFEVLLAKYPDFVEGWIILRMFYLIYGDNEDAKLAGKEAKTIECERNHRRQRTVEKSSEDEHDEFCWKTYPHDDRYEPAREGKYGMASFRNGISLAECLSWTISLCPPHNLRIRTTILLQKLGFYEFAAMTLADELLLNGSDGNPPPAYVYYTSVNHYLKGQYEDAVVLLQEQTKEFGKDCFIWSLLGHCYYKLQNHAQAVSCYEYVMQSYNRPDDIHLIYSRMGFYYLETNKNHCAKMVFQTACKYSPTPKVWKGFGIACLMTKELEEAEIAFTESNYLDNKDPDTWAYLGITNSLLGRLDLFQHCCEEAKKRGLQNPDVIRKIISCATSNGLMGKDFKF